MKTFKEITEANKKITVRDIVKILKSPDFGMTEAGGNGEARALKGKLLVKESCFYGCDRRADSLAKDWNKGGVYNDFFSAEYRINTKVENTKVELSGGKIYSKKAKDGVITLTISF